MLLQIEHTHDRGGLAARIVAQRENGSISRQRQRNRQDF